MSEESLRSEADVTGEEHWTNKGDIKLFLWEKYVDSPADKKGTIVFVHGSSMASQPTFDLHVEGRPYSSVMNWFALQGFDTWCVDMEGYGRSDKDRDDHFLISNSADDLKAACDYIIQTRGIDKVDLYGISSGALRAALFAQRNPDMVNRLAMDAMVWTGEGSPTLENRRKKLPEFKANRRRPIDLDFVRKLSKEADELGLARFVITGGEPLVMRDFDAVVEAIDPDKHYIITDTNGWFLDDERARHIKSIGVEKVQLSLDSMIEKDHDSFRNKPGSWKKAMRAIEATLDADLNLLLSTVLVKGRVQTDEFRQMCEFATERGVGLYVSYAKPTGSCTDHPEFVIDKKDADILREMEKQYSVFTHMTPSYGSHKGCITVKGIITVTSTGEVTPCPYIDFSLGNLQQTSLKEVLDRGMANPWLGPHRPDCLIGEDPKFIDLHTEVTSRYLELPVPWGEGFTADDKLTD